MPNSATNFPVEAKIPLFMTMEAAFSFKNLQLNFKDTFVNGKNQADGTSLSVFTLDRQVA